MIARTNISGLFLCTVLLFGCSPKLYAPKIDVPKTYMYGDSLGRDTSGLADEWWLIFGDSTLNRLIDTALAANRDLAAAASRIEEARYNLKAVRAGLLPSAGISVDAGASYSRPPKIRQQYGLEGSVSWEIPLFGKLRHTKESARAGIGYAEWAYRGVRLSLAAEVATAYFTLLRYREDLDIAERSWQLRRESAALIDSMYVHGMITGVNREQAMSLVYTAEADIPQYERAVAQTVLSLKVLLGRTPESDLEIPEDSTGISGYGRIEIPVGLPSDMLHRRPDVMEAYFQMKQAAAEAGLARSARFPSISLTGGGGLASDALRNLFSGESAVWSATGGILMPLLQFGALRNREAVAKERYMQSALAYEQACLTALSDVETALAGIASYREQTERYAELVRTNRRIALMSSLLYDSGMSAYLDVIDAERTLYDSRMQFVDLAAQQCINYVNLCKALGGGWVKVEEK